MSTTIQAILLASLLVTEDPNHDAWDAVNWARECQAYADAVTPGEAAMLDLEGRPVVDCLPPERFAFDAYEGDDEPTIRLEFPLPYTAAVLAIELSEAA